MREKRRRGRRTGVLLLGLALWMGLAGCGIGDGELQEAQGAAQVQTSESASLPESAALQGGGSESASAPALKPESALESASAPTPELVQKSTPAPTPEPTPEPYREYEIRLAALGDNLMHMGIVYTGKQADGSYDYSFLFRGIQDLLDQADIRAINQETVFGGNELGFSGFPHFNSPTQVGDAIAAAGFQVVLHATNHAADQGVKGLARCAAFWEQYPQVLAVGIHQEPTQDRIGLLQAGDRTFAVLNYTYGPNAEVLDSSLRGRLDMLCAYQEKTGAIDFTSLNPQVTEDIRRARELADVVVVFPHWGTEYRTEPSSYQRRFAQEMADAGADVIIGTHPHVPQPVELLTAQDGRTTLCFYSLGNYVSTQKQAICMLEEMAWVTFHVTEDEVYVVQDESGAVPLVCHYKSGPVRLENVYPLEEYTQEQAQSHGIRNYGGVSLSLEYLQEKSREILGEWELPLEKVREKGREVPLQVVPKRAGEAEAAPEGSKESEDALERFVELEDSPEDIGE